MNNTCLLRQQKPPGLFLGFHQTRPVPLPYCLLPGMPAPFLGALPNHQAGDAELGGPNAIVVAEGPAALAHDHGLQAAVALGG